MKEEIVEIKSCYNVMIKNEYISQESDTLVVILPGQGYLNYAPLMHYSYKIALEMRFDVVCINYGFQIASKEFDIDADLEALVKESEQILYKCQIDRYKRIFFIGKSLGTIIQNRLSDMVTDIEKFHIYLTPVNETFEEFSTDNCLVFTGTRDIELAPQILNQVETLSNYKVFKIQDANHSLEVVDTIESIEMLKFVMVTIKGFIEDCDPF